MAATLHEYNVPHSGDTSGKDHNIEVWGAEIVSLTWIAPDAYELTVPGTQLPVFVLKAGLAEGDDGDWDDYAITVSRRRVSAHRGASDPHEDEDGE